MPSHTPLIQVVKFVHAVLAAVEMPVHTPEKKETTAFHTVVAVVLMPSHTPLIHSVNAVQAVLAVVAMLVHVSENHFLMAFHAVTTPVLIAVQASEKTCPRSIPKDSAMPHKVSQNCEKKLPMAVHTSCRAVHRLSQASLIPWVNPSQSPENRETMAEKRFARKST